MPIEHINKTDTLNEGREKLNNAITAFNETVVEGDSSVEAAQARVDEKGVPHPTLKARIDDGLNSVNQQLAETAIELDSKASVDDLNKEYIHAYNPPNGLQPLVGDGIADDTQALQAMIDSARDNGVVIKLGAGTFRITSSLIFPKKEFIEGHTKSIGIVGETDLAGGSITRIEFSGEGALFDYTITTTGKPILKDLTCLYSVSVIDEIG